MSANRRRGWMVFVVLTIASFAFSQQAITPPSVTTSVSLPSVVRISGSINDSHAQKSGSAGVVFALYSSETSSTPLWTESQSVRFDATGRYSVILGANTAEGVPMSLFASGEARWLGFTIDGREQRRTQLVSVPYALKAKEAETLNGLTANDIAVQAATLVGQGSGSDSSSALTPSKIPVTTAADSSLINQAVINTTATNFADSNSSQVVNVTQAGTGAGLQASTTSATSNAILGINTSTTGIVRGVYGEARSASTSSAGVYGISKATTGVTYGVLGITSSNQGTALNGTATSLTGGTIGLRGQANSTAGIGVQGAATAATGGTAGVNGFVLSPTGIAGVFDNRAGGKTLSLRNNGVEKLSVDGLGNVTTVGSYNGSGAGLTSLNASNLATGGVPDSVFSGTYSNLLAFTNAGNTFTGKTVNISNDTDSCDAAQVHVGVVGPAYFCAALTADSSHTGASGVAGRAPYVGIYAENFGTFGSALWALAASPTGSSAAITAQESSPDGTAAILNNTAGGKVLSMQNNGTETASVDALGNIATIGGTLQSTAPMMLTLGANFATAFTSSSGSAFSVNHDGAVDLFTGGTMNSTVTVQASGNHPHGLARPGAYISARMRWTSGTVDGNSVCYAIAGTGGAGFGFYASGPTLLGVTVDGGGSHTVGLGTTMVVGSSDANFVDLLAVRRLSSIDYYVNGLLVANTTSNISESNPTSAYSVSLSNGFSTNAVECEVSFLTIGIPMK